MKAPYLLLLPVFWISACSTTAPPPAPPPAPSHASAAPAAPLPVVAAPAKPAPVAQVDSPWQTFERDQANLDKQSVYFDYDKYAIRGDEYGVIKEHASLPMQFPKDRVVLQGNCDERGGHEYNLALGQKRADAVKTRLALLGVPTARMETVSFGKEKPRESCHAEKCWSENRRVDFVDSWQ
jgi:peptidoglycan-associated lipoprotein